MATLSTAAWIAHDLGIATGVGGTLFGRVAMHPALRQISDKEERGQVASDAWRSFNVYQLAGLGLMAATWFAGRSMLSGREVDGTARKLVVLKDGLVIASVASAVGAAVTGRLMAKQHQDRVPMNEHGTVAAEAPQQTRRLNRLTDAFGLANLLTGIGVVATTAILAMKAGESGRWTFWSRRLV